MIADDRRGVGEALIENNEGVSGTETAGRRPTPDMLVDVERLVGAYYSERPDPSDPAQAVSFGTSGHRGSSLDGTFTESHIVAISEAIGGTARRRGSADRCFWGVTRTRFGSGLSHCGRGLGGARCRDVIDSEDGYTPTPAISHAILPTTLAGAPGPMGS